MGSNLRGALALGALLAASLAANVVQAQESVGDLTQVQARTILARAKNALADEEAKLAERTATAGAAAETGVTGPELLPVVTRVSGRTTDPTAYLLFQDGSTVPAKAGQTVRNQIVIQAVSAERVVVKRAGVRHSLGFSVIPPRQAAAKAATPDTVR